MKMNHALGTVALAVVSVAVLAPLLPVVSFALLGLAALAVPLLVMVVPVLLVGFLAFACSPARVELPPAEAGGPRLGTSLPTTSRA